MSAKQKIVHGHGPTNQNLGNFVCACDVCQAHNHSPLVTLSMQIPLLLLIDDVMCLKLEIHTWPSYLKSPVLSLYIARQLLRRWIGSCSLKTLPRCLDLNVSLRFASKNMEETKLTLSLGARH